MHSVSRSGRLGRSPLFRGAVKVVAEPDAGVQPACCHCPFFGRGLPPSAPLPGDFTVPCHRITVDKSLIYSPFRQGRSSSEGLSHPLGIVYREGIGAGCGNRRAQGIQSRGAQAVDGVGKAGTVPEIEYESMASTWRSGWGTTLCSSDEVRGRGLSGGAS